MGCCGAKGVEDYSAQGRSPPQSCLDKFSILSNINDPLLFWIMTTKKGFNTINVAAGTTEEAISMGMAVAWAFLLI